MRLTKKPTRPTPSSSSPRRRRRASTKRPRFGRSCSPARLRAAARAGRFPRRARGPRRSGPLAEHLKAPDGRKRIGVVDDVRVRRSAGQLTATTSNRAGWPSRFLAWRNAIATSVSLRLLGVIDGRRGPFNVAGFGRAHFDEDERATVEGDDIEFAGRKGDVAEENSQPAVAEKCGGRPLRPGAEPAAEHRPACDAHGSLGRGCPRVSQIGRRNGRSILCRPICETRRACTHFAAASGLPAASPACPLVPGSPGTTTLTLRSRRRVALPTRSRM